MNLFNPFKRNKNKSSKVHNGSQQKEKIMDGKPLSKKLYNNIEHIKSIFNYPLNKDFVIREIFISSLQKNAAVFYINGMIDSRKLESHIIKPLMGSFNIAEDEDKIKSLMNRVINTTNTKKIDNFAQFRRNVLSDNTVIIIDGFNEAISIGIPGSEHRSVEKSQVENVLKGPHEGFIENLGVNRSLIRKRVRDENLVTESIIIGERSLTEISMMYISDIANDDLVRDVKKRLSEIQTDNPISLAIVEQHLEERPYSLVPTVLYTERPDRAASFLQEGHIVLIDESAACLVVPVTFWSFFHTPEESYQRLPYANFIRLIRLFAYFVALLVPSLYLAMTNYHVEMIPTDLLLSIAATREIVPFPAFIEILIMELSFELLREAGVRIPTAIGPTIGIVGALILGQAAVEANIVSPILVIIVSITGLASFAIPNTSMNYAIRISRFIFLIVALFFGFFGVALLLAVYVTYMSSIKSFDVPFFAPFAPHYKSSNDIILKPPMWKQWLRPKHLYPKDSTRKKEPKGRQSR